ncbi:unnamed protein product [Moneuplotes crassus]|uniref:Uncharacterized protein n=1 Tax=Euplotes crassus TaxID=5936 RepID=A0AAD1XUI3_EUPCR|nr:unnamed protein product [Moneuplotes crassus]
MDANPISSRTTQETLLLQEEEFLLKTCACKDLWRFDRLRPEKAYARLFSHLHSWDFRRRKGQFKVISKSSKECIWSAQLTKKRDFLKLFKTFGSCKFSYFGIKYGEETIPTFRYLIPCIKILHNCQEGFIVNSFKLSKKALRLFLRNAIEVRSLCFEKCILEPVEDSLEINDKYKLAYFKVMKCFNSNQEGIKYEDPEFQSLLEHCLIKIPSIEKVTLSQLKPNSDPKPSEEVIFQEKVKILVV